MQTTTRNADLADLARLLQDHHARKLDVVASASQISSEGANLRIQGTDAVLSDEGVTTTAGLYLPTAVCDEGIAGKLGVPTAYLRRMRSERPDLYDANVNGWLHGSPQRAVDSAEGVRFVPGSGADPRKFLIRCLRGDEGEQGIARAWLSDSYRVIDNLDVLMSALDGIRAAGVDVSIDGCDLSERRMYVRVVAPEVKAYAEKLLRDYRNPFGDGEIQRWREVAGREGMGYGDGSEPVVFAGFVLSNSETGGGAFSITPRVMIRVCKNGLTITKDAVRSVHLGGKLEEGVINWSEDTQRRSVELVKAKTADAVQTFLNVDYLHRAVAKLEERAEEPVEGIEEVKVLTKQLSFSPEETDGILSHFIKGGQLSRAGLANAVTSYAQTVESADDAAGMEERAAALLS